MSVIAQSEGVMIKSEHPKNSDVGFMPELPPWFSDDAISVRDASDLSGYNPEYIRRLARIDKIESIKVGIELWVRRTSLEDYVNRMRSDEDARTGPRREGKL
ncbi:MAG: hypothetical protein ACE5H9_17815 [Anaerolineae bacterium]